MKLKLTLAQTHVQYANLEANFEKIRKVITHAYDAGSDLVLVPELWSTSYDLKNSYSYAKENKRLLAELKQLLLTNPITFAGTLIEEGEDENLYNVFSLIHPDQPRQTYRKIHLFRGL